MTIEHIQPSENEQIGQLLARCRHAEVTKQGEGFIAWVQIGYGGLLFAKTGTTQLDAIRNAVEAAEQGAQGG